MKSAHCFYGLHEVEGFTRSFADDLLRTLFVLAYAINGEGWLKVCLSLNDEAKRAESIEFKSKTYIFELESLPKVMLDDVHGDVDKYESIKADLGLVLDIAREERKPTDRPPYEEVLAILQGALLRL